MYATDHKGVDYEMMMPVTGNNATAIQLPFSDSNSSRVAHVKLQQWAEDELSSSRKNNQFSSSSTSSATWGLGGGSCDEFERTKKLLILRKATVAYGIATLLKQAAEAHRYSGSLDDTLPSIASINKQLCNIDNFIVRINAAARRDCQSISSSHHSYKTGMITGDVL